LSSTKPAPLAKAGAAEVADLAEAEVEVVMAGAAEAGEAVAGAGVAEEDGTAVIAEAVATAAGKPL
jgi:hypothetical protein